MARIVSDFLDAARLGEYHRWVLEDGARRPPSYYGLPRPLQNSSLFVLHTSLNHTTVLLWFARLFTPLSHGEGKAAEWRRGGGAVDFGQ